MLRPSALPCSPWPAKKPRLPDAHCFRLSSRARCRFEPCFLRLIMRNLRDGTAKRLTKPAFGARYRIAEGDFGLGQDAFCTESVFTISASVDRAERRGLGEKSGGSGESVALGIGFHEVWFRCRHSISLFDFIRSRLVARGRPFLDRVDRPRSPHHFAIPSDVFALLPSATDRTPLHVERDARKSSGAGRAVIFAVTVAANGLSATALEVNGRSCKKQPFAHTSLLRRGFALPGYRDTPVTATPHYGKYANHP